MAGLVSKWFMDSVLPGETRSCVCVCVWQGVEGESKIKRAKNSSKGMIQADVHRECDPLGDTAVEF
jgi:hypothetical protein